MIINHKRMVEELNAEGVKLIEALDNLLGAHGWRIHYDMENDTVKLTKTDLRNVRAEYELSLIHDKIPEFIAEEFLKENG